MAEIATRCDLTELLVEQCAHCRRLPDPVPRVLGRPFRAVYTGHCCDCEQPFAAGDRIRSAGDDGYVGPCCASEGADRG